jgi:hypothetical protein
VLFVAFKKPKGGELSDTQRTYNKAHNGIRAIGERGNSLLKMTFKSLRNVVNCLLGKALVNTNVGSEEKVADGVLGGPRCGTGDGGLLALRNRRADAGSKPPRGALAEYRRPERRWKRRGCDRVRCGPGR